MRNKKYFYDSIKHALLSKEETVKNFPEYFTATTVYVYLRGHVLFA